MKSKFKKALIIICSGTVLFLAVFFMTRSLNNLIEGSNKDNNVITAEDTSPKDKTDTQQEAQAPIEDNIQSNNTTQDTNEETQTSSNAAMEKYTDYVVKAGDTLYSIARKSIPWKSQEEAVKILETMNNLKDRSVIPVGSHLMIPVNDIDTAGCTKYTVKSGESLYNIAKEYLPNMDTNKAVDMIMKKNNLTNANLLSVGLEIYIPNSDSAAANSESIKNNDNTKKDSNTKDTSNENTNIDDEDRDDE